MEKYHVQWETEELKFTFILRYDYILEVFIERCVVVTLTIIFQESLLNSAKFSEDLKTLLHLKTSMHPGSSTLSRLPTCKMLWKAIIIVAYTEICIFVQV